MCTGVSWSLQVAFVGRAERGNWGQSRYSGYYYWVLGGINYPWHLHTESLTSMSLVFCQHPWNCGRKPCSLASRVKSQTFHSTGGSPRWMGDMDSIQTVTSTCSVSLSLIVALALIVLILNLYFILYVWLSLRAKHCVPLVLFPLRITTATKIILGKISEHGKMCCLH